ncbi:MAG: hypothetical protein U0556_16355 [Dehalococcoidia bacterium]
MVAGYHRRSARGRHNLANALAAAIAASMAGANDSTIRATLRQFVGVIETEAVAERGADVLYVNDSIYVAGASDRRAREPDRPVIWLAGGRSKNLPDHDLVALAAQQTKRAILYGEDGPATSSWT